MSGSSLTALGFSLCKTTVLMMQNVPLRNASNGFSSRFTLLPTLTLALAIVDLTIFQTRV